MNRTSQESEIMLEGRTSTKPVRRNAFTRLDLHSIGNRNHSTLAPETKQEFLKLPNASCTISIAPPPYPVRCNMATPRTEEVTVNGKTTIIGAQNSNSGAYPLSYTRTQ